MEEDIDRLRNKVLEISARAVIACVQSCTNEAKAFTQGDSNAAKLQEELELVSSAMEIFKDNIRLLKDWRHERYKVNS